MMRQLQRLFWLTGMFLVVLASAARADSSETSTISAPEVVPVEASQFGEEPEPATSVEEWMGQFQAQEQTGAAAAELAQALTQITGVQVSETENGLELTLEATGPLAEPQTSVIGNALTADIPNAVLALPEGEMFEQFGPAEGIALVSVMNLLDGGVRVSITGAEAPPQAEVSTETGNLVLSVVPGVATAADADDADAIQVVVTATRTEEEIQDVPRSVTVVTREQIEEQTNLNTNLPDILGQTVPGFNPPSFNFNSGGERLRGRDPQVLIDGVPVSTNFNALSSYFRSIPPGAIEQIEVVRGPSAAYGAGATGGVINIITRRPSEEELTATVEARVNSRGDFVAESFGNYLGFNISGNVSPVDYVLNFSTEGFGYAFDGAGDRIPGDGQIVQDARNINILGKLGVNIGENQRLQFSVNHLDESSDTIEFIVDPSVADDPDADKARALPVDLECIDVICEDARRFTTLNLNYSNADIFGSELRLQGFYRDSFTSLGAPFEDTFSADFPGSSLGSFIVRQAEFEGFGGRLEIETPISTTFNLLWGADYNNDKVVQPYTVLDDEFVTSGFRVARADRVVNFTPLYTVESLGVFAQAQWDITPRWLLSGGARYENIGLSVDDYTAILFQGEQIDVEGGNLSADDVVFNIGTVYDLTNELGIFASFSQGFGVPDFGRILQFPPFTSVENDLGFTAPQVVNNYELGVRGDWQAVQFSLAGFFNQSDLGVNFALDADGRTEVIRAPERIYGVEATVDWQPSEIWQLGGLISWFEGDIDPDDDGDFEPLNSFTISPLKITAYVENETLPGWRNRFQALFVGGRDRGPLVETDSYFVLDYISSIDIGPGSLQIGIQNLLDTEYFPFLYQVRSRGGRTENALAAPGRAISIGYRVTF
ncbi:TonB-dependent receptor [Romeria aff. gracilis LEGE 07310]|uniref:TonB-dependent receptor n=1 Tax=Vasconcelosia minhoensis LEGE 07310 TaxID=915328 RepID=A0A8J7AEC9_9CYAN|nr:TonB-dependent receptor [Romeria gracilis]MBE9075838.1 TonB-dependent receptor [Romeria aff. gracilis LEGE 07310]